MQAIRRTWGDGSWTRRTNPSIASDQRGTEWAARYERLSVTPGSVSSEMLRFGQTDIRGVLPSIQLPTLVLHRTGDRQDIQGAATSARTFVRRRSSSCRA